MGKKKIVINLLICLFAACTIFFGTIVCRQLIDQRQNKKNFEKLSELIVNPPAPSASSNLSEEAKTPYLLPPPVEEKAVTPGEKYGALYELNSDFVGWISVEGTKVNYPVMQTVNKPDFYLRRSFEKTYSDFGVPYLDEACIPDKSDNMVIYGHNMDDGSMFHDIVKYKDYAFFLEHPVICFDTLNGFGRYQVIAAFAFDTNNEDFPYNEYVTMDEKRFNEFIDKCSRRRHYDTRVTAQHGDKLLTLSTCEYSHENGRFVVVAKKLLPEPDEQADNPLAAADTPQ